MNQKDINTLQKKLKNKLQTAFKSKQEAVVTAGENQLAKEERLKKYAQITNQKIISSKAELPPDNLPIPELMPWCKEQGDVVVFDDGTILSSNPGSRQIQNCKTVMLHEGIRPGKVIPATNQLIQVLLAHVPEPGELKGPTIETVSAQQQRLRLLVREALQEMVSDIHIEVRSELAKIRFRKHGELYLHAEWLPKLAREIASVAFNKETDYAVTHFNPLVPQNASMPLSVEGHNIRLRLASLPAHGGFDVVLRVLTTGEEKIQPLQELGYTAPQVNLIEKAIHMPHGAIIISGPTGSGKTTTLASCINMISSDRKVYTIEDPVEKLVEKATQVPVNEEQEDRTFASMGRASLRMDPDVIVLGEMRDLDTAAVMTRASMTGHLVFSTLHTNTAPAIVPRLVDLGISPALLSDASLLICLIYQRLVPVLCNECAVPISESNDHKPHLGRFRQIFGDDLSKLKCRGQYCQACKGLGISGRTVVAEIVWIDEPGRSFIQKNDTLGWEKYLKENGWQPYTVHTLDLVKQGICDPLDAEKTIGYLEPAFTSKIFNYKDFT
jgi:type II secretory ATPase GspE/PulE/Tfp pilus assembly ATPase PilB-like protein